MACKLADHSLEDALYLTEPIHQADELYHLKDVLTQSKAP